MGSVSNNSSERWFEGWNWLPILLLYRGWELTVHDWSGPARRFRWQWCLHSSCCVAVSVALKVAGRKIVTPIISIIIISIIIITTYNTINQIWLTKSNIIVIKVVTTPIFRLTIATTYRTSTNDNNVTLSSLPAPYQLMP